MLLWVLSYLHSHSVSVLVLVLETFNFKMSASYGSSTQSQQQGRAPREPQQIIYSICIPRVFKNITEKRIRAILYSLKFGFVERVDMVPKTNKKGEEFWRVFVHFSSWNERSRDATQVREKLDKDQHVKIVYDNPWFWMISKSRTPPPENTRTLTGRPKPFIDFSHVPQPAAPAAPQSPTYTPMDRGTPRSPSPDYSPRTPSPEPTMPQRENTSVEGLN